MKQRTKIIFAALSFAFFMVGVGFIVVAGQDSYALFPTENPYSEINAYIDDIWGGNSSIESFETTGEAIKMKFTLGKNRENPVTWISFIIHKERKRSDFSGFSFLYLRIKESTCKEVGLYIKTFLPGVSSSNPESIRHNQYSFTVIPGKEEYQIPLELFTTAQWWLEMMGLTNAELPEETFERVTEVQVMFGAKMLSYSTEKQDSVVIENIAFQKSSENIIPGLLFFLLVYSGILAAFFLLFKRKKPMPLPEGKVVDILNYEEQDFKRVVDFISARYCEPDISTQMIYSSLGIHYKKVNRMLKERFHCSFKQFITAMRIKEAKRLLKESDLRVIDIAYRLGFNSNSYFIKLFKQEEGITPVDYRQVKKGI